MSVTHMHLVLPYPISANRYWTSFYAVKLKRVIVGPSKEATAYRKEVAALVRVAGIAKPIIGRVAVNVQLYPNRPLDYKKRMREHGESWDDTVMCLDLDNANKVLLDSLKGCAIDDDKWVRELHSERMEPDENGSRVVVRITSLATPAPQSTFIEIADEGVELMNELPF